MGEGSFAGSPESVAFRAALEVVRAAEPGVADAIAAELASQREQLKLIASENYASPAVLLAMGNWLSDKYAEGTAGRRVYAGCQHVDAVEEIAAGHARELFGMPYAYVQPHSGIDANLVAFWAVLAQRVETPALGRAGVRHVNDLGDGDWAALRHELGNQRLLGMSLDAGGHLTHGFRPNISGKMFEQASYGTDPASGLIDYDRVRDIARQFRPLILLAGYSAYPRLVNFALMRQIADEVGATLMADMAHFAGLVAGGVLAGDFSPVGHAHIITTTHWRIPVSTGTTYKQCSCRDAATRKPLGRACPRLRRGNGWNPDHGTWYYQLELPPRADGTRRPPLRKGGYASKDDAALRRPAPRAGGTQPAMTDNMNLTA